MKSMKLLALLLISTFLITASCISCGKDGGRPDSAEKPATDPTDPANPNDPSNPTLTGNKMKITVGTQTFTATLFDNAAASAFKALLPLTVDMIELNGNEKYFDLPQRLPTNANNPGAIQSGDLMLYGSSTLVLFYKSFNTSYSYTKLGRVDNAAGLAAALGGGNVKVTYSVD